MKKEELQVLLPRWTEAGDTKERFAKEASFALQTYSANGLLQKCTKESLLSAIYNIALTGLTLNPVLKYAALVPRYNSKIGGYECSLEPMYQGLIKLAISSGKAKAFVPGIVYEGDDFDMDYSNIRKVLKHVPYFQTKKDKGNPVAVYSIAILTDGTEIGEVMTWAEVEDIRNRSESYKAFKEGKIKSTVWVTDEGEMAKKTVTKRQLKYFDKGEDEKLARAIQLDNDLHGFRAYADANDMQYLETLIEDSIVVDEDTLRRLRMKRNAVTFKDEAIALREEIMNNHIQDDVNMNQGAIGKKVDRLIGRDNT